MPGDDVEQRGQELLTGLRILPLQGLRVFPPGAGDLLDRQAVLEPEVQQVDAWSRTMG